MHCKQSRLGALLQISLEMALVGLRTGELTAGSASACSKVNSFAIARVSYMEMDTKRLNEELGENSVPGTAYP